MKWMDLFFFYSASFHSIEKKKSHIKKEQIGPAKEITKLFLKGSAHYYKEAKWH